MITYTNIFSSGDKTIHVDFYPPCKTIVHGAELSVDNKTPEEAIQEYLPIAEKELLHNLNIKGN